MDDAVTFTVESWPGNLSPFEWRVLRVLARDFLKHDWRQMNACTSRILSTYERRVRNGVLSNRAADIAIDATNEELKLIINQR
jgi:hypothetical protein